MKKIVLSLFILFYLSVSTFASTGPDVVVIEKSSESEKFMTIEEIDGNAWCSWTPQQRVSYMYGFLSANSGILLWVMNILPNASSEQKDFFYSMLIYPGWTAENMALAVTSFYDVVENDVYVYREFSLYKVTMLVGGKNF